MTMGSISKKFWWCFAHLDSDGTVLANLLHGVTNDVAN